MDQGQHECEIWHNGTEAGDERLSWKTCTKNPGHHNFIPVKQFSRRHLPKHNRPYVLYRWICAIAMLTVRIRVSKVSKDRPDGYTFFEHRGESMTHVGSGLLTKIASGEGKCCCDECCRDSTRKQKWWIVTIKTACHVVFNTEEAVSTFVDLFYEDEDSLKKGTMKKMHGWRVQDKDEDGDWCMLQCAIHDTDLARQLIECVSLKAHWKRMFVSLQKKT